MKKSSLIKFMVMIIAVAMVAITYSCTKDDADSSPARVGLVKIDPVATDDVIDAIEVLETVHTVSGTAIGGSIATGDSVIVTVNGTEYTTTVTATGTYSVEVATSDLVDGNTVSVVVVSSNGSGTSIVRSKFSKTVLVNLNSGGADFTHPGLLVTQSDFDRIKLKVDAGEEPWLSGWDKLINNYHAQLNYSPHPVVKLVRGGRSAEEPDPDNYASAFNDAAAAFQLAIRWKITGDNDYADKSIEILNAWASTCTKIGGNTNVALAAGIYGNQFANAAEIMRGYTGWSIADFNSFKTWMVDVFYPISKGFLEGHFGTCDSHYWANWDLVNLANVIAIGVLTDDVNMYNFAINYLKTGSGNGNLNNAIYYIHPDGTGQMQESGRDQGHALLCIGVLGEIAQMATHQGDDLFAYNDYRILRGAEYQAKYNVANLDVPFQEYTRHFADAWTICGGVETHTAISAAGRGEKRPIWNVLHAYAVREGLSFPYLELAAGQYVEGGGGNYSSNSGGYDSLGFGTLLYSE